MAGFRGKRCRPRRYRPDVRRGFEEAASKATQGSSMTGRDDGNGHSKDGKYKVGYRRPPLHSRFEAGTSGNPKGRPKQSKARNIRKDLQEVYLQEISVGDGKKQRRMAAVVVLHEKVLRDGL